MEATTESGERHSLLKASNEKELSRGLFTGDTDDEDDGEEGGGKAKKATAQQQQQQQKSSQPERYDEDGLDDFIEDDVGDGGYRPL